MATDPPGPGPEPATASPGLDPVDQLLAGAWAPVSRDTVHAEGPDATSFLQGQLSQDLLRVEVGDAVWSLVLAPQGKVDAWVRVLRTGPDGWALDVDAGWGDALLERLGRFKLRTKVDLHAATGTRWLAVRGPAEVTVSHPGSVDVPALPVWWRGTVGYDLVAPDGVPVSLDVPEVGADALETLRVRCGVPAMGAELTSATIPAEMGQWFIDASVSFTKGCYTGQELVARIDSRGGNVPRRLQGLRGRGNPVASGAELLLDGTPVGSVTSVAPCPAPDGTWWALGVLARSVEVPAALTDSSGTPMETVALPMVP